MSKIVAVGLAVLLVSGASMAQASLAELLKVPSNYPGLDEKGQQFAEIHRVQLQEGVRAYYALYGYWPLRWADVVEEGLVTVEISTPHGNSVNPDDPNLDFDFDAYYSYRGTASAPEIAMLHSFDSPAVRRYPVNKPEDWRDRALRAQATWQKTKPGLPCPFEGWENQPAQLKRLAICDLNNRLLAEFMFTPAGRHGSWNSFVGSGCASVTAADVNPITGLAWLGDGSVNDLIYHRGSAGQPAHLDLITAQGRVVNF
jgi:hypothetical protein